jgi:hypothetical protein
MIQEITIGLLFAGAIGYLGSLFRKSFSKKSTTCVGCGCGKEIMKNHKAKA